MSHFTSISHLLIYVIYFPVNMSLFTPTGFSFETRGQAFIFTKGLNHFPNIAVVLIKRGSVGLQTVSRLNSRNCNKGHQCNDVAQWCVFSSFYEKNKKKKAQM